MRMILVIFVVGMLLASRVGAEPVSVQIPGTIYFVSSPANVTWAAGAATLKSWLQQSAQTSAMIAGMADPKYGTMFAANQSIGAGDESTFLGDLALTSESQQTLTPATITGYLRCYGPLWITDSPPIPGTGPSFLQHAFIVSAITGDTTPTNGSALNMTVYDASTGTSSTMAYSTLLTTIANDAITDYGAAANGSLTIVHFPCGAVNAVRVKVKG